METSWLQNRDQHKMSGTEEQEKKNMRRGLMIFPHTRKSREREEEEEKKLFRTFPKNFLMV